MTFRKNHVRRPFSFKFCMSFFALLFHLGILVPFSQAQTIQPHITIDGSLESTGGSGPQGFTEANVEITQQMGVTTGANLFHSFGQFNIPTDHSVTFSGDPGIANVLSRVTGGEVSSIDGTLASTIENANLFLFNPAGVVFGSNATLEVKGAFYTSTADFIRLGENGIYHADLDSESILTMAQPEAFGFLSETPADITVNGSSLQVPEGEALSLVGGDIRIAGTLEQPSDEAIPNLAAESGQVSLVSVASVGEVEFSTLDGAQDFSLDSIESLGEIGLVQRALVDTSGESGGMVVIRSGILTIEQESQISANTAGPIEGILTDIPKMAINVETESLVIQDGGLIVAGTFNASDGGDVQLKASETLQVRDGGFVLTFTEDAGNAGNIEVDAGRVQLSQSENFVDAGITSQTDFLESVGDSQTGNTGNIRLNAQHVEIMGESAIRTATSSSGNAGDVDVIVDGGNLAISGNAAISSTTNLPFFGGLPGNINLQVEGGDVILNDGARIRTFTTFGIGGFENKGNIQITANNLEMHGEPPLKISQIAADSLGSGKAGGITVTLTGNLQMEGDTQINVVSRFLADANALNITAKDIFMTGTGETGTPLITTKSQGEAQGGNLNILAENLTLTAESQINSQAEGSGNAGNINIELKGNLLVTKGSSVTTESISTEDVAGNAGNINLRANNTIFIDNAKVIARTENALGGNIKLDAGDLIHVVDSEITSQVQQGSGNAGSINIDPEFIVVQNSRIDSSADVGDGGDVTFVASSAILFDSLSTIDASSRFGGNGVVDIQAPIQNLSGTIAPLPEETTPVTALYSARCAAGQGGNFSTFVNSKTDSFSPSPGTFLSSPLLSPSIQAVPNSSSGPQGSAMLTASVVPLVLGQSDSAMACP